MVLLGVETERELMEWSEKLEVPFSIFVEPDIGNMATAIAVSPQVDNGLFRDLKLL